MGNTSDKMECPSDKMECPICYELLLDRDVTMTKCGHSFHASCLIHHMMNGVNTHCPSCRNSLYDAPPQQQRQPQPQPQRQIQLQLQPQRQIQLQLQPQLQPQPQQQLQPQRQIQQQLQLQPQRQIQLQPQRQLQLQPQPLPQRAVPAVPAVPAQRDITTAQEFLALFLNIDNERFAKLLIKYFKLDKTLKDRKKFNVYIEEQVFRNKYKMYLTQIVEREFIPLNDYLRNDNFLEITTIIDRILSETELKMALDWNEAKTKAMKIARENKKRNNAEFMREHN
jgi:hypothetical protein